jgi:hypothetical protein
MGLQGMSATREWIAARNADIDGAVFSRNPPALR